MTNGNEKKGSKESCKEGGSKEKKEVTKIEQLKILKNPVGSDERGVFYFSPSGLATAPKLTNW